MSPPLVRLGGLGPGQAFRFGGGVDPAAVYMVCDARGALAPLLPPPRAVWVADLSTGAVELAADDAPVEPLPLAVLLPDGAEPSG